MVKVEKEIKKLESAWQTRKKTDVIPRKKAKGR